MDSPLLAFYGDDFTGSTDAMAALSTAGIRTVLFTEPPDPATLEAEFPDAQAVGLAGMSRSMTPAEMDAALPDAFAALARLDAPVVHYKVCSTFDSSPSIGSIGRAIDVGRDAFDTPFVPLVVGAPALGRYVVFANHFASVGDATVRLDRHPTMSEHPVTPMTESDLRRHLGDQTDASVGLVDALAMDRPFEAVAAATAECAADNDVVLFDTLTDDHLATIGRLLWERADEPDADPLFTVGSSGVEYALADHWSRCGRAADRVSFPDLDPVDRLVVMSGSASPVNEEQVSWALDDGFAGVRVDAERLVDPATAAAARGEAVDAARAALDDGRSVVLYTARGPADPAIEATKRRAADLGIGDAVGRRIGDGQGTILRAVLEETGLRRACVAGGDTCGRVVSALDVYALETVSPTAPGSPLCRARSHDGAFDGLQLALKGGQLGQTDYFGRIRRGE